MQGEAAPSPMCCELMSSIGFFFSSYRQTALANSPVVVSMDQYYRLMKDIYDAAPRVITSAYNH
jgi:hypothetical protein